MSKSTPEHIEEDRIVYDKLYKELISKSPPSNSGDVLSQPDMKSGGAHSIRNVRVTSQKLKKKKKLTGSDNENTLGEADVRNIIQQEQKLEHKERVGVNSFNVIHDSHHVNHKSHHFVSDEELNVENESATTKQSISTSELNSKLSSSKYDFVKVRVWLDEHYYILSRFIVSRMLTMTSVNYKDSIKIALQLKKRLVDMGMLNLSQKELEEQLFDILNQYNYEQCIEKFRMVTQFYHKRTPLLILIYGTGCIGKSTLATQLAERLNIPNVLQTDLVLQLLGCILEHINHHPEIEYNTNAVFGKRCQGLKFDELIWLEKIENDETFLKRFKMECKSVKEALQGDIVKCFDDGKPIIIEGSHIDPSLFVETLSQHKKKGIIIPFFLCANEQDHKVFQEQWLVSRCELSQTQKLGLDFETKLQTLCENFQRIEQYLKMYEMPDTKKIMVNIHQLDTTLDSLHLAVLEKIEKAYKLGHF